MEFGFSGSSWWMSIIQISLSVRVSRQPLLGRYSINFFKLLMWLAYILYPLITLCDTQCMTLPDSIIVWYPQLPHSRTWCWTHGRLNEPHNIFIIYHFPDSGHHSGFPTTPYSIHPNYHKFNGFILNMVNESVEFVMVGVGSVRCCWKSRVVARIW